MDTVPRPIYPPLLNKPLNLEQNEKIDYLVNIKQTLRNSMKDSIFYVPSKNIEKANFNNQIERYSDKYTKQKISSKREWTTDWNILPKELKFHYLKDRVKRVGSKKQVKPPDKKSIKKKEYFMNDLTDLKAELEDEAEINEDDENEEETVEGEVKKEKDEDKKSEKENDSENEELNQDDDDMEEDNDYIDTYFDNGENYDDDDGGDDDGGTY